MSEYILELKNVTKKFPGVVALRNMSIQLRPGEVHGLIGENGAGKSTLIKVLTGIHAPEEGEIYVEGKPYRFSTPTESREAGIACVYQELNIVKMLSVTDNIFINKAINRPKSIFLDSAQMDKTAHEVMTRLGHDVDVRKLCGVMGMGVQQMVEIARAILIDAKVIIMDEPTSSLGEKEAAQLMHVVRELKESGVTILFVSHKLEELYEICDRVTVMRDGEHILTDDIENLDNDKIITAMVGRTFDKNMYPHVDMARGEEALRVEHLESQGAVHDVSFKAYKGEILGFAGLVGAGRTETMRVVFGAAACEKGEIYKDEQRLSIKSPRDAIKNRIAFLTEDRKGQGLVLSQSIDINMVLASMKKFSNGFWYNKSLAEKRAKENINDMKIKTAGIHEAASQLSGGNQQKVVIGKWINTDADIFIFDEPTRGIDVGAKVEVYHLMNRLKQKGKCIIMVSSELPEILGMSDRVIVMREGRITGEFNASESFFNQDSIMKAAWGKE